MKTVVGMTIRGDAPTADLLSAAIRHRGGRLVVVESEAYPSTVRLDATLGPTGYRGTLTSQAGEKVDLEAVHSVWWKRLDVGIDLRDHALAPSVGSACRRESDAVLRGVMASLPARMVNDVFAVERAETKVWQLARAAAVGLDVPATHFTNRAGTGPRFGAETGALITKRMSTTRVQVASGERRMMTTAAVSPDDLVALDDALHLSPATLQGRVEKVLEVRASVVGDRVFASGVDSQAVAGAEVDWRVRSDTLMADFRPVSLPDAVVQGLLALHRDLGLVYSGADLICTPEGRWMFLETNPSGEWDWIQASGHDVAGALADLLLDDR